VNKVITLAACLLMAGCSSNQYQYPAVQKRAAEDCAIHKGVAWNSASVGTGMKNDRRYRVQCLDGYYMEATVRENE
jgi:hypothetical protein